MGVKIELGVKSQRGPKGKYLSDIQNALSLLFEQAEIDGHIMAIYGNQIPSHGGVNQGFSGVRIKKAPGARGRRVSITLQVGGNESRYEFYVKAPAHLETEEFIRRLERARDLLASEERGVRVPEAVERLCRELEDCADCLTGFELLPEALVKIGEEEEYRIRRSVFELLDDDQEELLIKVSRVIGVLTPNIGKGHGDSPVYSFNKKLHQKIVDDLYDQGHLVKREPEMLSLVLDPQPAPQDKEHVPLATDLSTAQDLLRDAETRLAEMLKRQHDANRILEEKEEELRREMVECNERSLHVDEKRSELSSIDDRVSQIRSEIQALEILLSEAVSKRGECDTLLKEMEVALSEHTAFCKRLVEDRTEIDLEILRTTGLIGTCEAEIAFAKQQIEEISQRARADAEAEALIGRLDPFILAALKRRLQK